MSGRAASRLLVSSVVFFSFALVILVLRTVRGQQQPQSPVFFALQVGFFVLSLCLFAVAITMAAFTGSLQTIGNGIFAVGPMAFFHGVADDTYGSCVVAGDPNSCAKYCCASVTDPTVRWRDCDKDCTGNSKVKFSKVEMDTTITDVVGVPYSDCSTDMTLGAYCNMTLFINKVNGICNHDEHLGPVTCACCVSPENENISWWDCNDSCNSANGAKGIKLPISVCLEKSPPTSTYSCLDEVSKGKSTIQNNNQSF